MPEAQMGRDAQGGHAVGTVQSKRLARGEATGGANSFFRGAERLEVACWIVAQLEAVHNQPFRRKSQSITSEISSIKAITIR